MTMLMATTPKIRQDRMTLWEIPASSPHAGRIGIGLSSVHIKRVKALPGTLFSKYDDVWTLAKTYPGALMLGALSREIGKPVAPTPELREWVAKEKAAWAALAELAGVVMVPEDDVVGDLFRHQVSDIAWLTMAGGPSGRLLLNEMGVGKTRSVILSLELMDAYPALVVCPKMVMVTGWQQEFEDVIPGKRRVLAPKTLAQRRKAFQAIEAGKADVLVMGYEAMRVHTRFANYGSVALKRCPQCHGPKVGDGVIPENRCQAHAKELNKIPWKAVVADEIHRVLNASSQTRLALAGLVRSVPVDTPHWGLTGTPVSKRADGLWSLLNFADPAAWPVKSDWVDRYCQQGLDTFGFWTVTGFRADTEKELHVSLDAISRRVLKAQVLDLPPLLRWGSLVREVSMGTEQKKAYDQMRDELILQVKEGVVTASDARVKIGRLMLLAGATGMPGIEKGEMFLRPPSCKVDELAEMIREQELGESYAVAFTSRRMLRMTLEELVDRELLDRSAIGVIDGAASDADRDWAVQQFQSGKIPCVMYTHAAGGTGITLHRAESLVLIERSWSPILMSQSLARVHRAGMPNRAVNVIDVITAGTVEARQLEVAARDADLLEAVVGDQQRLLDFIGA